MTIQEKSAVVRMLRFHLDKYRQARRDLTLAAIRGTVRPGGAESEVSFHALGLAEALDRLNGSTR